VRFPINLASQPFRRDRPIIVASALVGLLLVLSLGTLISLAMLDRRRSAETRQVIARLQRQMQTVAAAQTKLNDVLRRPENAEVLERSLFLNTLLHRKGISWTKILADLEKTEPHNVRIVSIRPQVTSENQIYLEMTVGAESQEPVGEFLIRLEASPLFGATTVYTISAPSQTDPLFRYRVSVNYAQKL